MAEDAWNTRNPEKVSMAYTIDSEWRNRNLFINGREEIVRFLTEKWEKDWITSSKKNIGRISIIELLSGLNTSTEPKRADGSEPTVMKIESLTKMVL